MTFYKIALLFRVWICTCEDPTHTGDDVMCPRHGFGATVVRGFVLFILSLIVVAILFAVRW